MDTIALTIAVVTYTGVALGGIPGLALDRTGIALLGAIGMVVSGELSVKDAIMKMPRLKRVGGACPCSRAVRWVIEEPAAKPS